MWFYSVSLVLLKVVHDPSVCPNTTLGLRELPMVASTSNDSQNAPCQPLHFEACFSEIRAKETRTVQYFDIVFW